MLILLMVSGLCGAQYSNHQLYQAYLDQEVTIWEGYIVSVEWGNMSIEEKKQLLNYEYGYTAVVLGKDKEQAEAMLQRYEQHLQDLKDHLPQVRYEAYMASVYAYKMALDKTQMISCAKNVFACIDRIKELETEDAFALSMLGNVELYAPTGNKKRALEYFQRADSIYSIHAEEYEQWNHHAVKMCIEQCKKKLNR